MMKTFAERLRLVMGDASPTPWGMLLGIPPATMDGWLNKGASPYPKTLEKLVAGTGIPSEWWLHGEGDPPPPDPELLSATPAQRVQEGQVQYMAGDPMSHGAAAIGVNSDFLRLCLGACVMVHGEAFAAESAALQLEYACDLYNQLMKQAAANGHGFKAAVAAFSRLETRGLAAQLRLLLQLDWARKYDRKTAPPEGTEAYAW